LAGKKAVKLSGTEQVVAYLDDLEHPLKPEIEAVRRIILDANERLSEHIKWKAPSFCYDNEDRVTFNLHGKGYFQLVFHCGAKVKDTAAQERLLTDDMGLLQWVTVDRGTIKFTDMDDVIAKKEKLADLVNAWIAATSSQ